MSVDYSSSPYPVRRDIVEAHRRFWDRLAAPGAWWTGAEKNALARACREAWDCGLCRERKAALSPNWAEGDHEGSATELPPPAVEVVHRVTTDPQRLLRRWFEEVIAAGLSVGQYVEAVGTTAALISIDGFSRGLGLPPHPLPKPLPGQISRYEPVGATQKDAWAPMIPPENAVGSEADIYGGHQAGNVIRALSYVPDEVRTLQDLSAAHYLPSHQVRDPVAAKGALSRPQTELVAGRVSELHECFY